MIKTRNVLKSDPLRKQVYVVTLDGTLAAGDNKLAVPIGGLDPQFGGEVESVYGHVKTAPTGSTLTIQLANGSTDILSTVLTFAIGATTASSTAVTPANKNVANGDIIDFDIDQGGSSAEGADLTLTLVIVAHGSQEG